MQRPQLIAHRGDTKNFPENTLEAFSSAVEKGADGIEFDVHLNDEGVPIVVHNYLFDRQFKYPLLSEIVERFGQQTKLEMEIKSLEEGAISRISEVIEEYCPLKLEVTSSVPLHFQNIAHSFPTDARGLIFRRQLIESWMPPDFVIYWITRHVALANATVLHLDLDLYSQELVTVLHQQGFLAHTHLKDASPDIFQKVKKLGIDQCTFDDIDILKQR